MQPTLRLIIALTLVGCGSSSSPDTGPSAAVARSPAVARLPALGNPVMLGAPRPRRPERPGSLAPPGEGQIELPPRSPAIGAVAASDDGATLLSDVYAFHVNLEQRAYIDAFGAKVLPQLVR